MAAPWKHELRQRFSTWLTSLSLPSDRLGDLLAAESDPCLEPDDSDDETLSSIDSEWGDRLDALITYELDHMQEVQEVLERKMNLHEPGIQTFMIR